MASRYSQVLQSFPKGYSLAFAYGSGVFKQIGHQNVKVSKISTTVYVTVYMIRVWLNLSMCM